MAFFDHESSCVVPFHLHWFVSSSFQMPRRTTMKGLLDSCFFTLLNVMLWCFFLTPLPPPPLSRQGVSKSILCEEKREHKKTRFEICPRGHTKRKKKGASFGRPDSLSFFLFKTQWCSKTKRQRHRQTEIFQTSPTMNEKKKSRARRAIRSVTFTADTTSQMKILRIDGDTLAMDGTEVGIFKERDQVGLGGALQGQDSGRLEAKVATKIGGNFTHKTLEGQLANEEVRRLLELANFTQSNRSRAITVRLLDAGRRSWKRKKKKIRENGWVTNNI